MKIKVSELRMLVRESVRFSATPIAVGDLVEIYDTYEEKRSKWGVKKKSEFGQPTTGIVADVEIGDDGYIRVGLKPDPSKEPNVGYEDEIFTWVFPSSLRKI